MADKSWAGRIRTLIGVVVFCVLFAEVFLLVASVMSPMVDTLTRAPEDMPSQQIPDDRLGVAGNPEFPFHDARGFRNPEALETADIAAIGDSHTYGTGVRPDEAWPAVLARTMDMPVYSISLGGYGAAHANENLDLALSLKPRVVLFALYFGNDFYEDFRFAAQNGQLPEFASDGERRRIDALELAGTIESEVGFLFGVIIEGTADGPETGGEGDGIFRELARWSRLAGFIHGLQHAFAAQANQPNLLAPDFETAVSSMTERQKQYASPFDDGAWRTVLTAPYRLRVMDDSDLRIEVGLRVTRHMIDRMAERVAVAGSKFGVVLLPTKEFVFGPRVVDRSGHPAFSTLMETEARMHREIGAFLDLEAIPYIDVADALRGADEQPYFVNGDGHPNPLGHVMITAKIASFLERLKD